MQTYGNFLKNNTQVHEHNVLTSTDWQKITLELHSTFRLVCFSVHLYLFGQFGKSGRELAQLINHPHKLPQFSFRYWERLLC